jgi:hypothetical protein
MGEKRSVETNGGSSLCWCYRIMKMERAIAVHQAFSRRLIASAEKVSQPSTNVFGLTGMAERTSLLGGEFKVRSTLGRGMVITVEISQKGNGHG